MRQRDLEGEVVDRLQAERAKRRIDARGITLRVQQRHPATVEDRAREEGSIEGGESWIDEALPGVHEILGLDGSAVPVLGGRSQMKDVDGPVVHDVVAFRRRRRHAFEIGGGFQQRLGDGAKNGGLVGILRLTGVERPRRIVEEDAQRLVLRQARALHDRRGGVASCDRSGSEQCPRDGTHQPSGRGHRAN